MSNASDDPIFDWSSFPRGEWPAVSASRIRMPDGSVKRLRDFTPRDFVVLDAAFAADIQGLRAEAAFHERATEILIQYIEPDDVTVGDTLAHMPEPEVDVVLRLSGASDRASIRAFRWSPAAIRRARDRS